MKLNQYYQRAKEQIKKALFSQKGYIDDVRVTKGLALYDTNLEPEFEYPGINYSRTLYDTYSSRELAQLKNANHWSIDMIAEFYSISPTFAKELLQYHGVI